MTSGLLTGSCGSCTLMTHHERLTFALMIPISLLDIFTLLLSLLGNASNQVKEYHFYSCAVCETKLHVCIILDAAECKEVAIE